MAPCLTSTQKLMLNASNIPGWVLLFWLVPSLAGAAEPVSFLERKSCRSSHEAGAIKVLAMAISMARGALSFLRGWDAATDHRTITHDSLGRRIDRQRPASSLFLLKAIGWVPHEGGVRYRAESPQFALLRSWIDQGCPDDTASAPSVASLEVLRSAKISGGSHGGDVR